MVLGLALLVESHGGSADEEVIDGPAPNLRAKGLILVKVYCLIIVFFATLFAGISPYFFRWNSTFLVLGTQFAGGIFLATALLHFLSDAHNSFQDLTTKQYAFAEMLAMAGYLITMFGDLVIQWVVLRSSKFSDEEKGAAKLGYPVTLLPILLCRSTLQFWNYQNCKLPNFGVMLAFVCKVPESVQV